MRTTEVTRTFTYAADQQAAIVGAIKAAVSSRGVEYDQTGVLARHQITGELFAVFGSTAYKLMDKTVVDSESDTVVEYVPAVCDGHLVGEFPDEGRSGVLHIVRIPRRRGVDQPDASWQCIYVSAGWIHTHELNKSNSEILENIEDEIDAGMTPLTGGRAGWA